MLAFSPRTTSDAPIATKAIPSATPPTRDSYRDKSASMKVTDKTKALLSWRNHRGCSAPSFPLALAVIMNEKQRGWRVTASVLNLADSAFCELAHLT
jgi:hypothetical protein